MPTTRFPVENVSWYEVQDFIKKLNERAKGSKLVYRLPTEEEWECACRGGPGASQLYGVKDPYAYNFYFDKPTNLLFSTQANFNGNHPFPNSANAPRVPYLERTCEVGLYVPNCPGIYDMHGNVSEWTSSLAQPELTARVSHGGYWGGDGDGCRPTRRYAGGLTDTHDNLGFRLVAVPSGKE